MSDEIVFLDIDGTLLNEMYESNDESLKDTIIYKSAQGVTFVLNSNRSLEDLIPVANKFGINALLVGENGMFIYDMSSGEIELMINSAQAGGLVRDKFCYEKLLFHALQDLDPRIEWFDVDTVQESALSSKTGQNWQGIVALNNKYRLYTSSTYIYRDIGGVRSPMARSELICLCRDITKKLGNPSDMRVVCSEVMSSILCYSNATTKRRAVEKLLRKYCRAKSKVFAIGDESGDFNMINGIGTFLTTSNAKMKIQRLAFDVSSKPYAQGVNELIQKYIGKTAIVKRID